MRGGALLASIFACACMAAAQGDPVLSRRQADPSDELFTNSLVRTFKIEVAEPALTALKKDNRSYVRGTLTEGGTVLKDVGLHLKGMGSFRPLHEKPSFSVKFDRYTPDQHYFGLTKLMLNNASQDPTYLAELLGTQMFRDAGVPAARVTHAYVEFNGRPLGLYVLIEAMNKEFLKRFFQNTKGNLYEAYLQDIDQKLDQDGGPASNQADLKKLVEVCRIDNPGERWDRLHQVLDVDGYLSHLAVEMFTSHTDGYAMNRNNYRIYHDPATDRFVFITHGVDWAFGNTGVSIRPPQNSIVTRAVLQTPEGQRLFRERLRRLFAQVFQPEVLSNRVEAAVLKLKAAARSPAEAREFENCGVSMQNRLRARHENIARQLLPDPDPVKFDSNGVAALAGWRAQKHSGEAQLDQPTLDGKPTLHLRAQQGQVMASWRLRVMLEPGQYRLRALARTSQVVGVTNTVERGNGAGLRVSGGKRGNQLTGDSGWTPLEHPFEVKSGEEPVELLCELRASKGEVWFDAGSLTVRRGLSDGPTGERKL